MAVCYAITSAALGTVSFLIAWLAGHGFSVALAFYALAGLCGLLLVALRAAQTTLAQPGPPPLYSEWKQ